MNSVMAKIKGFLLLFIFLLAVFFSIIMPFEIRDAIQSQSWESHDLLIQSSKVVTSHSGNDIDYSLEITATDLSTNKLIKISDVQYGDFPFTISIFGRIISSDYERYVKKYPAGAKVAGYKDPNHDKYVLERGDVTKPVILMSFSLFWTFYIIIHYPRSRKNKSGMQDIRDSDS